MSLGFEVGGEFSTQHMSCALAKSHGNLPQAVHEFGVWEGGFSEQPVGCACAKSHGNIPQAVHEIWFWGLGLCSQSSL